MKIGYPGLNRSIGCLAASTFRLKSYSERRLFETVAGNLDCLERILRFNLERGILFFRITSDLVPFASHPVCAADWRAVFARRFARIGAFVRAGGMRISMHPDQYVRINARDRGIVERSVRELRYHAQVLDALELDATAKIQIHLGGVYGDKPESMRRFVAGCRELGAAVLRRLVVENDDRSYSVDDCLAVSGTAGIPVLFDDFHHALYGGGKTRKEAFAACSATWGPQDGLPMIDYSLQEKGKRSGAHAETLDAEEFSRFLEEIRPFDGDIMLEIKDKEKSALEAVRLAAGDPRFIRPGGY